MKKLLITGGAGFIGSNFVNLILKEYPDWHVTVLDALTYAGNKDNISQDIWKNKNFRFRYGYVNDRKLVEELVSQSDQIVHFAAETHVDNSIYNTDDFIDTDVKGTQILLDAVRKHPVERFVHISTSEVYGTALYKPMDESHPLNPRSPYASAKTGADRLVYSYFCTFNLPVIIVRPFNNYGPRQHIEKLIPCFITRALQGLKLPLHGEGISTRDWLYVEDCCEAIKKVLEMPLEQLKGEVINIGTGKETSIVEITRKLLKILNKDESLIEKIPDRLGQVDSHLASWEKAKRLLNWEPRTNLEEGLKLTVNWYKNNEKWYKNNKFKYNHIGFQSSLFNMKKD